MIPATRLSQTVHYLRNVQTSALKPVLRPPQTGVFFSHVCMFLYKVTCGLLVITSFAIANAGQAATTIRADDLAGTAAARIAAAAVTYRQMHPVNAIGSSWAKAAASIVQREDHHFYVVREASLHRGNQKAASAAANVERRIVEVARAGNLVVDQSLLLKSAAAIKSGQR